MLPQNKLLSVTKRTRVTPFTRRVEAGGGQSVYRL